MMEVCAFFFSSFFFSLCFICDFGLNDMNKIIIVNTMVDFAKDKEL